MELGAARAIGPIMLKYEVEPFIDDRRCGIPVEGMLQNNEVVVQQQFLFMVHVDQEIGIGGVDVMNGDAVQIPDSAQHFRLHDGVRHFWMGKNDEDFHRLNMAGGPKNEKGPKFSFPAPVLITQHTYWRYF